MPKGTFLLGANKRKPAPAAGTPPMAAAKPGGGQDNGQH